MTARYARICKDCEVPFKTKHEAEMRCTECRRDYVEEEMRKQELVEGRLEDVDQNGEESYIGLDLRENGAPRLGGEWDNFINAYENECCNAA